MALSLRKLGPVQVPKAIQSLPTCHRVLRYASSTTADSGNIRDRSRTQTGLKPDSKVTVPLQRLPTSSIFRILLLGTFFTSSWLFKPGLAFMRTVANSKSSLLNPDRNLLLKALIKPLVYDQFCAGTNSREIQTTVANIRRLGFSGVILCYGKEFQIDENKKLLGPLQNTQSQLDAEVEHWKVGNLRTLSMIGEGDWLGIKFTGAGQKITEAHLSNEGAPPVFVDVMDEICKTAKKRGCRIWIDGEQQAVQTAIDSWTIDLMRRWNRSPKSLIYNTIQSYLKTSRTKLQHQLHLAQDEGWKLAIKLVRGAYMSIDARELIHATKADTDASYESIVRDLLQGTLQGFSHEQFPGVELFLAGHNSGTIRQAYSLAQSLSATGQLKVTLEFGQLQGMADDIGCELLQERDEARSSIEGQNNVRAIYVPRVYKCLTWGSIQECMQYLVRRAVENQGAADRMKEGRHHFAQELKRRIGNAFSRRYNNLRT